jgi:hypothetical protein
VAHRTAYKACPVHHRTTRWAHKSELQRSNPNGLLTWLAHRTVSGGAPDCPVRHATAAFQRPFLVVGVSGATATSCATVDCNALNARLRTQRSRARVGGTPDSLQGLSGAPPDNQVGPQVRAPTVKPQWSADVAGTPDSVRWRTGVSGAPCDCSLPTTIFGGWGYKYPNHPTFNGIQVFHSSTPYKS